jgi:hypothetical protein
MLFKVLDENGRSCNGGNVQWSLPIMQADGSFLPGDWMPAVTGELVACKNGYHLREEVTEYVIEYAGPSSDGLPVKDQGWRVYELTYARSYKGNPIKRKIQRPYRKLRTVCLTEVGAKLWIERHS